MSVYNRDVTVWPLSVHEDDFRRVSQPAGLWVINHSCSQRLWVSKTFFVVVLVWGLFFGVFFFLHACKMTSGERGTCLRSINQDLAMEIRTSEAGHRAQKRHHFEVWHKNLTHWTHKSIDPPLESLARDWSLWKSVCVHDRQETLLSHYLPLANSKGNDNRRNQSRERETSHKNWLGRMDFLRPFVSIR